MKTSSLKFSFSVMIAVLLAAGQATADTTLESAIREDDAAAVQLLLEQGATTDTQSNRFTPLAVAAMRKLSGSCYRLAQIRTKPV